MSDTPEEAAATDTQWRHIPVLLDQVMQWLDPRPGQRYIDATVGLGGHSAAILDRSAPDGRLLAIDADPEALAIARRHLAAAGDRVVFVHGPAPRPGNGLRRMPGSMGVREYCWTWAYPLCSWMMRDGAFPFARQVLWTCAWTLPQRSLRTMS